jgi:hypothetical protein
MFRKLVIAGAVLAAAGMATAAHAQKSGEKLVLLGTFKVDTSADRDTLDVTKASGKYRGLRIAAEDGDITLSRVQITYSDGSVHNENRRIELNDGDRTKPIDPETKDRFVDKVTLTIVPTRKKETATIAVYGIGTAEGVATKRPPSGAVAAKETKSEPAKAADTGAVAQKGDVTEFGDVLFGAQNVGFIADRDVIRVGSEIGKFSRIRLRVLENDITLREMKVVYANGESEDVVINADIKRDTRTRWFPVKGNQFIKEVQLAYNSRPSFKGQARIEVLGDYADNWLGPSGEGRKFNQGWVLLGSDTAGFIGLDTETIRVGRNEGGFRRIRVSVKDRAISLNELRIVYGNGQTDVVPVKAKVEAGSTYGPIDLQGGTRIIKEIKAKYRSRIIDREARGRGRATVEIWGQH